MLRGNTFRRTRGPLLGDPNVGTAPQRDLVIENNLLVAQAGMFAREDYNLIGSGRRGGAQDLSEPPRFVDAAQLDYRLAGGSPGIDAGTSDGAPTRDMTGAARVDTPAIPNTGGGAQPPDMQAVCKSPPSDSNR